MRSNYRRKSPLNGEKRQSVACSSAHKDVTSLSRGTDMPIRIVYEQSKILERMWVRSAFRPLKCEVHRMLRSRIGRNTGKENTWMIAFYSKPTFNHTCGIDLAPFAGVDLSALRSGVCWESYRKRRERAKEHYAQARNQTK